jgi:hypothetical protein
VRLIAAAVCALGLVAPVSAAVPATAAQAAPVPVNCTPWQYLGDWYLPYGCASQQVPAAHKCAALEYGANYYGTEAIQCGDIYFTNDDYGNGHTDKGDIWGEGEFYCQESNGDLSQCSGMNVQVDFSWVLASTLGGTTVPVKDWKCNPNPGPACPTSARAFVATQHATGVYTGAPGLDQCYTVQTWLPEGNAIAIQGLAFESENTLLTPKLTLCFASPGETNPGQTS